MPITKSATKAARQNLVQRARRQPVKTQMKTMIRNFTDLIKEGKKDEAAKLLPLVQKSVDMAAKRNLIHRNNASRKKSSMAKMLASKN
jgi:small subunit ribosomal protein S20